MSQETQFQPLNPRLNNLACEQTRGGNTGSQSLESVSDVVDWVDFIRLCMGTNILFTKSLQIGANGTNKVSLPWFLLCSGPLEAIWRRYSFLSFYLQNASNGPIVYKNDTREQQLR